MFAYNRKTKFFILSFSAVSVRLIIFLLFKSKFFTKILKIVELKKLILIIPDWRFRKNIKMNQIQSQEWVISFFNPYAVGILNCERFNVNNSEFFVKIRNNDFRRKHIFTMNLIVIRRLI